MNAPEPRQVCDPVDSPIFPSILQRRLVAGCLVLLMAAQLLYHFSGLETARYLSWIGLLGVCVFGITRLGLREFILIPVGAVLVLLLYRAGAGATIAEGLDLGALLSSFVLLLGLLREGALTSPSVLACGDFMTRQPPQRRYAALHAGGHIFGLLLNFGALSLLAPLVQRGVRAGNYPPQGALIRERRQLSALLRGFCWIVTWSPTTVTHALVASIVAGVDPILLSLYGLALTVFMAVIGWGEDYVMWRGTMARARASGRGPASRPDVPGSAFRNLGLVCLALVVLPAAFAWFADVRIVHALMLSAPIVTVIWITVQNRAAGPRGAVAAMRGRMRTTFDIAIPNTVREAVTMGSSGILGTCVAALAPVDAFAAALEAFDVHPALFLVSLPVLMALGGQVALSPVVTVVLLAAVVGAMPALPADPTLVALALTCGWTFSVLGSPNVSGAIVLSRVTGHGPIELTWIWNGLYMALAIVGLGLYFWLLTSV